MNERPKLGSEQGGLNVHLWVELAYRAELRQSIVIELTLSIADAPLSASSSGEH